MSIKEGENCYREALRYLDNASVMQRTNYYQDAKYEGMKSAANIVEQIKPTVHSF